MAEQKENNTNKANDLLPFGVKFVSWIYFIAMPFFIFLMVFSSAGYAYFNLSGPALSTGENIMGLLGLIGTSVLFTCLYAWFPILLGFKLKRGRNWARIIVLIFAWFQVICFPIALGSGSLKVSYVIPFLVQIVVIYYFNFNKETKAFFKQKSDEKRKAKEYIYRCTHCNEAFDTEEEGNEHLKRCKKRKEAK